MPRLEFVGSRRERGDGNSRFDRATTRYRETIARKTAAGKCRFPGPHKGSNNLRQSAVKCVSRTQCSPSVFHAVRASRYVLINERLYPGSRAPPPPPPLNRFNRSEAGRFRFRRESRNRFFSAVDVSSIPATKFHFPCSFNLPGSPGFGEEISRAREGRRGLRCSIPERG